MSKVDQRFNNQTVTYFSKPIRTLHMANTIQSIIRRIAQRHKAAARRDGRILVMDDEEMLRDLSAKILRRFGYEVATAADGHEAIELYKKAKRKKPFDAVIMDLSVPNGLGGKETIGRLRELDPNVKAILSSGSPKSHPVLVNYKNYGFSATIDKPFEFRELKDILKRLIH